MRCAIRIAVMSESTSSPVPSIMQVFIVITTFLSTSNLVSKPPWGCACELKSILSDVHYLEPLKLVD